MKSGGKCNTIIIILLFRETIPNVTNFSIIYKVTGYLLETVFIIGPIFMKLHMHIYYVKLILRTFYS